jgi:DNA invertase Pin-like site-specific DNA recombinase
MDPAMDTSSPAVRFVFNVLASVAQFEREIMLTGQREGIAKAKGEGKYEGRKPTARAKALKRWRCIRSASERQRPPGSSKLLAEMSIASWAIRPERQAEILWSSSVASVAFASPEAHREIRGNG